MKYEIHSKSDFLTGSFLIVRIPENELDKTALKTIQADCPGFILPFSHRIIDGQAELVYQVGSQSKLRYISGCRTIKEYTELWSSLLQPLTECGDWFMNPYAFVLDADFLYYDKSRNIVNYIYIPAAEGCSDYSALKEMITEVSKMINVSDAVLENLILRAIVMNCTPTEILQMLKAYTAANAVSPETSPLRTDYPVYEPQAVLPDDKDFSIDITSSMEAPSKAKAKKADPDRKKESGGFRVFGSKSNKKRESHQEDPVSVTTVQASNNTLIHSAPELPAPLTEDYDITQSTPAIINGTGLRYIGYAHLPQAIEVSLIEGEVFTIGRYDASIGTPQSSFEFDKKTKAVSRRHAVIERDVTGYKIIDLSSSAGTFVDSKKLPPNTPYGLETGCRVSFGNSGADYVWEAG